MSTLDNAEFWYKIMRKSRDTPSGIEFNRPLKFTVDAKEVSLRAEVIESTEYGLHGGLATRHFYYIRYEVENVFTFHIELTHIKSIDYLHDSGLGQIGIGAKDHSFAIISKEKLVNSYVSDETVDHYLTMFVLEHGS